MGPAFYILAILGCGEADSPCQQVGVAETRYESAEACNAATVEAVERNADLLFPVIVAQCRRADSQLSDVLMPDQVELPEADAAPAAGPAPRQARKLARR